MLLPPQSRGPQNSFEGLKQLLDIVITAATARATAVVMIGDMIAWLLLSAIVFLAIRERVSYETSQKTRRIH